MTVARSVLVVAALSALSGCPLDSPARLLGGPCDSDEDCATHLGARCVALLDGARACALRGDKVVVPPVDSGAPPDSGTGLDAGALDAGVSLDAAAPVDAAQLTDAGPDLDAGPTLDAGVSLDAAALPDAGDAGDAGASDASFDDGGAPDAAGDAGPDAGPPPCPGAKPTGPFCDASDSALALCFDFETTAAGAVVDGSSAARNGTFHAGAAFAACRGGLCLQPNLGYLKVNNFDFGADFTLEAWLYLDAYTTTADSMMIADNNGDWGFSVTAAGSLRCNWSVVAATVDGVFPTGRWVHAGCRQEAGYVTLYLDGALVGQSPTSGTREAPEADDIFLGANSPVGDRNWPGRIDDVRFWTNARDPALLCWQAQP